MAKPTKDNRKSVVDFGVGWVVIIYCLLMFFLYVGMCNDGANITAPNVAYRLGLEQGDIMNMNSLAGLVGVVFFIIAGQVNRKIGARMTSGICCIISGIAYILACNAPSIVIYTVCMCFVYAVSYTHLDVYKSQVEELAPMRGSKYVQSDLGGSFSQVKALLEEGTAVLFSGVPCQVDGLKRYLGKD